MRITKDHINSILFGTAVGDALGVPVEFRSREYLKTYPVNEMLGFGSHDQPNGTWSDDSSMTFCLAETLLDEKFELNNLAHRFIKWLDFGYWTPWGHVFDIGNTTSSAIDRLRSATNPIDAGGKNESDNGNGSLMRILPLVISTCQMPISDIYDFVRDVSSLTHAHVRSINCCFYYIMYAKAIVNGQLKEEAYETTNKLVRLFLADIDVSNEELSQLYRVLSGGLKDLKEDEIRGSGYVVHSLEASIWCLLNSQTYSASVLKAINLGEDTDTTGAITGGISALAFGFDSIPAIWLDELAKKDKIQSLANKLVDKYTSQ